MFGGMVKPEGSTQEFWGENKIGGRGGWGSYTVEVLLLILIFQLAAKIRFLLGGSFLSTIIARFRSAAAIVVSPASNNNHSLKLKNPTVSPSKDHPHKYNHRVSEAISDLDLRNLIDSLDEKSYELEKWDTVIDRQQNLLAYSAKSCKPKDGPLKYLSVTIFENCSAEKLRNFYMDNEYRKNWDKTLAVHEQLEVDESNGTEIGRIIKKFPLLTGREYILAWRVWEAKDGTFYCFSKVMRYDGKKTVVLYKEKTVNILWPQDRRSMYVLNSSNLVGESGKALPGRNACEIKMVHQEDAGLNAEMAKLAFSKGIWSYVCKMDHALRQYSAVKCLQSSLGVTAVTLIQQVPEELNSLAHISGPTYPENSATNCGQIACEGRERKFLKRPSNKLMAKGLILLGGAFCMSRGHSNLGAKLASSSARGDIKFCSYAESVKSSCPPVSQVTLQQLPAANHTVLSLVVTSNTFWFSLAPPLGQFQIVLHDLKTLLSFPGLNELAFGYAID
ncbi:hypothetical protein RHMOL_Rhmol08G0328000 [Rhododendron molle]|uniref:Uncharacterized protein n=1 Tax=Rhododendron molle TaxID=49168 RepID=A0ACC0MUY3_RHOML|nr:hypothetical protein RHMOL_Rhmol08G0328000 [Rhododendron molle]